MAVLADNVVIVAYPLRNGAQALMPRAIVPRACVRLDGTAKVAYASRTAARSGCPKHETAYRCGFCAQWHRATKHKRLAPRDAVPVAWVRRRAA